MKKYNTIYIYIGEEEQDKIILEKDWSYIYYSIPFSFPNAILEMENQFLLMIILALNHVIYISKFL